jgi:hypothetical protein
MERGIAHRLIFLSGEVHDQTFRAPANRPRDMQMSRRRRPAG